MKKANLNLTKLVNILNDGHFHSGDEVGEKLGITRSAVWKAIKKLENYQIGINSIKGKGYALADSLILLDSKKIKQQVNPELKSSIDLTILESVDSTNNYLKKIANKNSFNICLAEHQTQGKGRFHRHWHSPFAQNIYFSCQHHFNKDPSELAGLSLVIGLAVIKTLQEIGVDNKISIKWPNDILWQTQKLAGILIEINAESHGVCEVIIGIGINTNMIQAENTEITQPWISLQQILKQPIDRNIVIAKLINHLTDYLQQFTLHGLSYFIEQWHHHDHLLGQSIALNNGVEEFHGKAAGINQQGHLLLKLPNGATRAFSSGDTSIGTKSRSR